MNHCRILPSSSPGMTAAQSFHISWYCELSGVLLTIFFNDKEMRVMGFGHTVGTQVYCGSVFKGTF